MVRRYVAETKYNTSSQRKPLLVITVYPESDNLNSVERDIGILTARKGILRSKKNNQFKYRDI